jgi:hypothetical protein
MSWRPKPRRSDRRVRDQSSSNWRNAASEAKIETSARGSARQAKPNVRQTSAPQTCPPRRPARSAPSSLIDRAPLPRRSGAEVAAGNLASPSESLKMGDESVCIGTLGPASRPPSFFAKLFQRSVVPMPSFSKQCLGGFVGFQRVMIDPNPHCSPPNFYLSNAARGSRELGPIGFGGTAWKDRSINFVFPKEMPPLSPLLSTKRWER